MDNKKAYKVKDVDSNEVLSLSEKLSLPKEIAQLLISRGMRNEHEIIDFILTDEVLLDPFGLPDLKKVVDRITMAVENNELITICGDYDVDGTIATTILYRFLKHSGANVNYFIPDRVLDGYGVNSSTIKKLKENGTSLAITVDTGSTAFDAADACKELGMDLIITDHHNLPEVGLPDVFALVNPKLLPEGNSYDILSGGGVAYYLVRALNKTWSESGLKQLALEDDYQVLAMISTIADVVSLKGDNRVIVKYGLKKLKKCRVEGLQALAKEINIYGETHAKDIAFKFAPAINAAGRIGNAEQALSLFIETNLVKAEEKAKGLLLTNEKRKEISNDVSEKVLELAAAQVKEFNPPVLVIDGDFHEGVIGISAAKVVEAYGRPAMIIGFDGPEGKASCRSIKGLNVKDAIDYAKEFHLGGGGHDMAAGFSIAKTQVSDFRNKVIEFFNKETKKEVVSEVDVEMDFNSLNEQFLQSLERLEPFGQGNPTPILKINNCPVETSREIKGGGLLMSFGKNANALFFNPTPEFKSSVPKTLDVIVEISSKKGKASLIIKEVC